MTTRWLALLFGTLPVTRTTFCSRPLAMLWELFKFVLELEQQYPMFLLPVHGSVTVVVCLSLALALSVFTFFEVDILSLF